ncbi:delta(14)-sterol reductase TM7SF2 [Leguminivora glycinivorella]|uniref:delta(14)-sterol reductase TM7SF2 n=1 Tax=Leguminivora glycinivorella TaxID=1035111 RepID=UPI00200C6851|nr:delta(14)-sterol reductase TM7SF2 [Leguminivora glycinivorella]
MMSTRSGRVRPSMVDSSPPRGRKGVSPPRSPARGRKSSPPARSPSRKSPARKSPSRKPAPKFPARKSPSRSTKDAPETAPKSPVKRPTIPDVEIKLQDITGTKETYRSVRTRRSEYSIKDYTPAFTVDLTLNGLESELSKDVYGLRNRKPVEEVAPRRSSRLRESSINGADIRRSQSTSKSLSKSVSQSIDTFSEGENSEEDYKRGKSKSVTRRLATPLRDSVSRLVQGSKWEFGGRIGSSILILLLPLTVLSILISCTKVCTIQPLKNWPALKNISLWFSLKSTLIYLDQVVIQALLALLPILGPKADRMDDSNNTYCFNAFFSSIITIITLFSFDFFQIIDSDTILNDYLKLAVIAYIFALILSVALFLKSRKSENLNPYGNTGYVLYDFWMGREIHPFIKKLDVKIWISRISNITALILSVLIFKQGFNLQTKENEELILTPQNYNEIWKKLQFQPTIILYSMMQINYLLNFIMREYRVTTTFFWQSEGLGYYQIVSSALYPFYFTTISKFVADANITLSNNILIMAAVIYITGFLLMMISNNIKHEFRKNPLQPSVIHLDSMPTFHGKKLLISSTWGLLRHPNYLGDILIHIALAIPGIVSQHYVAAAPALLTIVVLLHRAWRDHSRCQRRYGTAWQRYCKKVPSVILPKIL